MKEEKIISGILTTLYCCEEVRIHDISKQEKVSCPTCGMVLLTNLKYKGFVYILGNPFIREHVKIGYTERKIKKRIKELSSTTGVPTEFELIAYFCAENGLQSEKLIHKTLEEYRTNTNREFFNIMPSKAVDKVEETLGIQPEIVNEKNLKFYDDRYSTAHFTNTIASNDKPHYKKTAENICPKCDVEMRTLKKGGYKCRKCRSIFR